jgi:hypothetical protein
MMVVAARGGCAHRAFTACVRSQEHGARWRKWMEELSSHDDAHRRLLTPILYYKQVYQLEKIEEH